MFQRLKGNESGQSIVIIALAMVAIIGMAALVLDGGYAYLERRRVQNAADAAVLAGVRSLATGGTERAIRDAIDDYAVRNGITSPSTNIKAYFVNAANQIVPDMEYQVGHDNSQIPADAVAIVVKASEQHDTFFAQVIGFRSIIVTAVAQAAYSAASYIPKLLPLAVVTETLQFDQEWELWNNDAQEKGLRDWLNLDTHEPSEPELGEWMCNGFDWNYSLTPPLWIGGSPGNKAVDLTKCDLVGLKVFVPMYGETALEKDLANGQCIYNVGNVKKCYHIIGFGSFEVTEVQKTTDSKYIKGKFVKWVAANELDNPVDTGTLGYRLTPPVSVP